MKWFRFYSEVLDDPKVQRLPPVTFKRWVNLLCLAGTNEGRLPPEEDIAYRLRLSLVATRLLLSELILAGLVDEDEGWWTPHGWGKRQFASDNVATRVKRHRADTSNADVTLHETPPEQNRTEQNRTEADTEQKQSAAAGGNSTELKGVQSSKKTSTKEATLDHEEQNLALMAELYEATIGGLTRTVDGELRDWCDRVPERAVRYGFAQAALQNKRSLSYVIGVWQRLETEGWPVSMERDQPKGSDAGEIAWLKQRYEAGRKRATA